jgi:hypothetical protein
MPELIWKSSRFIWDSSVIEGIAMMLFPEGDRALGVQRADEGAMTKKRCNSEMICTSQLRSDQLSGPLS